MVTKKKVNLTTRGRHAIMAMLELARGSNDEPVSLARIARSGNISLSYLEQLFACLRRYGLVKSYRGPGGGYVLAKPADRISISAILISVENCRPGWKQPSEKIGAGKTNKLWAHIGEVLYVYLQEVSLQDVVQDNLEGRAALDKLFEKKA